MSWKVLKTQADYKKAKKRLTEIFAAADGTPEANEADEMLLVLVQAYQIEHKELLGMDPIQAIKNRLSELGLKPKDLEPIIGSRGQVSKVLNHQRELTLSVAKRLKEKLNIPAEVFFSTRPKTATITAPKKVKNV